MRAHDWSLRTWLQVDLGFNKMWDWCDVIGSHIKHLRKRHTNHLCNYKRWGNSVLKNQTFLCYSWVRGITCLCYSHLYVNQCVSFNCEGTTVCSVIDICVMTPALSHSLQYERYGDMIVWCTRIYDSFLSLLWKINQDPHRVMNLIIH